LVVETTQAQDSPLIVPGAVPDLSSLVLVVAGGMGLTAMVRRKRTIHRI
jgi:hypothetical protein